MDNQQNKKQSSSTNTKRNQQNIQQEKVDSQLNKISISSNQNTINCNKEEYSSQKKSKITTLAKITDFFTNTSELDIFENINNNKDNELLQKQIQVLQSSNDILKKNLYDKDEILKGRDKTIQNLKNKKYMTEQKYQDYKKKVTKQLSKIVFNLEKEKGKQEFQDLMLKKRQYGFLKNSQARSLDDWVEGIYLQNLKKKKNKVVQKIKNLDHKKRYLKSKKNKKESQKQIENEKEEIKLQSQILQKQFDELQKEMDKVNKIKFEIILADKKLEDIVDCCMNKEIYLKDQNITIQPWPKIGKGGFAEVYKCYDLYKLRNVVVKVHLLNQKTNQNLQNNFIKHIKRENEVFKKLNHPNIVKYYDTIEIENYAFCTVLEYCEGKDLDYKLKLFHQINEKQAKLIIKKLLEVVLYLNQQTPRIIHYDLKPQNILFDKFGNVKVTDFGLCKLYDPEDTKIELTSQGCGTFWYLPPECFEDGYKQTPMISSKVDIWSIGIIFYQILYGKKPFGHRLSAKRFQQEQANSKNQLEFPKKPNISSKIKKFIVMCLEKNQNKRIDINSAIKIFNNTILQLIIIQF